MSKSREPDFYVKQPIGEKGKSFLADIGGLWKNEATGYITGQTVHGPIVIESKELRKELQAQRQQQKEQQGQEQSQSQDAGLTP